MPAPCSVNVSAAMLGVPVATKVPPVPSEFWQPAFAPTALLFPHGHGVPDPSPRQYANVVLPKPGTSAAALIDAGDPLFNNPSVTLPGCGATFASKRKL